MDPKPFSLQCDSSGQLLIIVGDPAAVIEPDAPVAVTPVRAFPYSDPNCFISLVDAHGRELGAIDRLDDLPPAERQRVLDALQEREFVPEIKRIVKVVDEQDPEVWEVETDRGRRQFLLRNADDVRRLSPYRFIIADMHAIRYSVTDSRVLDSFTRRVLNRY